MRLSVLTLLSATALVAACSNNAPADSAAAASDVATSSVLSAPLAYRCDNGTTFSVAFDTGSPTAGKAIVELNGATYTLTQFPVASGVKYVSDTGPVAGKGFALWNKQSEIAIYELTPTTDNNPIEMLIGICNPET